MIAYLKSTLKLPTIGWIVDTGTYIGIGNSVVNKNLSLTSLANKFMPYTGAGTTAGNSYSTAPVIYDTASTGSNLMLTGNNCLLRMQYFPNTNNNNATYLQSIAKPGGWQAFCYGTYSPYFTSTQGITNGNTYNIIGNEFNQVASDGTLIKLNSAIGLTAVSGNGANYHCNIIAENGNYFIGLESINGAYTGSTTSSQANFKFFSINKNTWAFTVLGVFTNLRQYWYSAPKFMGITNDNKVLIACYPVPSTGAASGVYGTLYYYIYDLNLNTVSQSTTGSLIHNASTVTTCSVPSSWSTETSDTTKNKFYIANCNSVAATATTISRIIVPKTLQNKITGTNITDPSMGNYAATAYNITTNIITTNNDFIANQAIQFGTAFGNINTGTIYYVSSTNLTSTGFSVSTTNGGSIYQLFGTTGVITSAITCLPTTCTTPGLTVNIPHPNNSPTTNTSTGTVACLYLNQLNTTTAAEYIVVITMGYANITGTGGYTNIVTCTNGCYPVAHTLNVFKIDPTNSANLIPVSSINDGTAFGTNNVLFNFNASADNTKLVLSNETQFVILTWNVTTQSYSYSRVYTINDGIGRISLDTTNQLWIHSNTTSNVYVYNINNVINAEINYTNGIMSLDYTSTNLSTNAIINSYTPSSTKYYSIYFNGTSYFNLASPAGLVLGTQNFTIETWFNPSSIGAVQYLLDFRAVSATVAPSIYIETTGLVSYMVNGVVVITSTGVPVVANTWNHIAVVKNSGSTKMYLNGTQVGVTYTDANTYVLGTNRPAIGAPFNFISTFTGSISNLRIVTGASGAVYTANFTPSITPLTAITGTQLLMCQSATVIDNSSNNLVITSTGTPVIQPYSPMLNQSRQVGNISLSVSGPATFTSTGTNTATITTSATADTTVPLTVTGSGNIAVTPISFTPVTTATPITTTPPTTTAQPTNDPYRQYVALHMKNTGTNTGSVTSVDNTQHIDSSSTPLTIYNNGNVMQSKFSPYFPNWSNFFDGTSYFNLASPAGLVLGTQNFTIETWFNPSSIGAVQYLLDFRAVSATVAPSIYIETTGLVSYMVNGVVVITSTGVPVVANTWNHIAVVKNSGSTKMYLNGTQVGVTYTDANTYAIGALRPAIGANGLTTLGGATFTGFISNLRIVTGSSGAVYTANFTPPTTALTAITGTQLLMCQANRFIDSSTSANAITITGVPKVDSLNPFVLASSYSSSTYGGSGMFNGNTSYLNTLDGSATAFGTNNYTIEGWIFLNGLQSAINYIYDARPSGLTGLYPVIYINASNVILFNLNGDVITGSTLVSNTWYHVAVSRNGTSTKMFLNGVQVGSTYTDSNSYVVGMNRPVIGANGNATLTQLFNGYIANLRVLNGTSLYSTTFTPPTSLLTNVANTALLLNFNNYNIATNTNNNTIIDSSSNNNAISVLGNGANTLVGQGSFNPYEPSYSNYFNGGYLSMATTTGLSIGTANFTLEYWINLSTFSTSPNMIDFRPVSTNGAYITMYVDPTGHLIYLANATLLITSSTTMSVNTWYHIAMVKNSGTTIMYINGIQVGSYADSISYLVGANRPTIGAATYTPGTYTISGYMSNVRLVVGTAVYTTTFTPPIAPLTAITGTQLLMCQANRFIDNSSNNNAITPTGTPYIQSFTPFTSTYNPANYSGSIFCNNSLLIVQHNNSLKLGSNNFTVEMWVYPTNFATIQTLIYLNGNTAGVAGSLACNINTTGTIQTYVSTINTSWSVNAISTLTVTKNCWNHITVVRNGTSIITYINGVSAISQTLAGALYESNQTLIGAYTPTTTTYGQLFTGTYITDFNILIGTAKYTAAFTPSLTPIASTANTALLLNGKNGGLYDSSMNTSLQTLTSTTNQVTVNTTTTKFNTGSTYFNGINSYLISDYKPQLMLYGNFTIEMWINGTTQKGIFPTLLSKNATFATANNYFICYKHATAPNVISFHLSPSTPLCYGTIPLSDNTWYHIAVVRNNNMVTLYVNGNPDCSFYSSGVWDYSTLSIGNGAGDSPSQEAFGGYIDDLRITNGIARYTTQFIPSNQPMQVS